MLLIHTLFLLFPVQVPFWRYRCASRATFFSPLSSELCIEVIHPFCIDKARKRGCIEHPCCNAPFTPEEVPATSLKFRKNCLGRSANFVVFEKCEIVPCMLRPRHVLAKFMLRWWCSHWVYCARRRGPCGVETVPATSSLRPSRLRLVVPTSPSREYNDPATEYA